MSTSQEFKQNLFATLSLGTIAFFFSLRDKPGSDIEIGRNHLLEGTGNNLLGAWSSWFYSIFPNTFVSWHINLVIFQITLSVIGIFLFISKSNPRKNPKHHFLLHSISYFIIDFASQQSRDGTMMAFMIFSIGLWRYSTKSKNIKSVIAQRIISVASLIIAFAFRPWLAFSLLPIMYLLLKNKSNAKHKMILLLIIMVAPSAIENMAFKTLKLDNWYPQQTVMIHDLAATYCWNSSLSTRKLAWEGLDPFTTSNKSKSEVCQAFKPNTWQAVVADGASTDSGFPPLRTVESNNDVEYRKLKDHWLATNFSDPFSYIQNHLMFSTQVLIAGETRGVSLFSLEEKGAYELLNSIWKMPSDLAKTLHLTSPIVALLLYVFTRKKLTREIGSLQEFDMPAFILIAWIGITSIGYVSDNGRYTLAPVLILYSAIVTYTKNISGLMTKE